MADEQHERAAIESHGPAARDGELIEGAEFAAAFGESLDQTLDLDTWLPGENLADLYSRLEEEVRCAVASEDALHGHLRQVVLARLRSRPGAPPGAGVYQATAEQLDRVHRGLLFAGAVEACDGTCPVHDTLPLTIIQIGVALVSYRGDQGSWVQRLFRRDLRATPPDPTERVLDLLDARRRRAALEREDKGDRLSELGRRGLMTYAERALLLEKATAPWRLGHGSPVPLELLTGLGSMDLLERSLDVLRRLLLAHRRWLFVPSAPADRGLLTIGNALHPLEYAIVDTLEAPLEYMVDRGHYPRRYEALVRAFVAEAAPRLVAGVYRASAAAPAQVFYAHAAHAQTAALIALADSTLQEHRGFPLLLDLADRTCAVTFGGETLRTAVRLAYDAAGAPYRYLAERQTRYDATKGAQP